MYVCSYLIRIPFFAYVGLVTYTFSVLLFLSLGTPTAHFSC